MIAETALFAQGSMPQGGIEKSFTDIYKRQQWGPEGGGSGPGSSEVYAAGASRILFHVIMMFDIKSMIVV